MLSLNDREWKEFSVGSLFDVFLASGDTQADKCEEGKYPLVSSGSAHNGVCKFIGTWDKASVKYDSGTITVDMFGKAFTHEYSFFCVSHGRVNLLRSKTEVSRYVREFFVVALNSATRNIFSYSKMCSNERLGRFKIILPVDASGQPDYAFMEQFMKEREQKILSAYADHVRKAALLHEEVTPLQEKEWSAFAIGDLFELTPGKGKGMNHLEADPVGVPYLGATNRNNAVLGFVKPVAGLIQKGNCIAFIRNGEGSMGYSVYKCEDFIATSDITVGYAPFLNKYTGLFITTVADKVRVKYDFNYKRSSTRLKRESLLLPVNTAGQPDWDYMERYVKQKVYALQLQYLQRKLGGDF